MTIKKTSQHLSISAFRYGSKVFLQSNANTKDSLTDFIVIASNSKLFHEQNIKKHGSDYSFWFRNVLGSTGTTSFQRYGHCKVFFNTNVENDRLGRIKYGVIDREDALNDLLNWESLYVAGRMHKPIDWVIDGTSNYMYIDEYSKNDSFESKRESEMDTPTGVSSSHANSIQHDEELHHANLVNRQRALLISIFLLMKDGKNRSHTLNWHDIYTKICRLSYDGDIRMRFALEHKNKIGNIVDGQRNHLDEIYRNNILPIILPNVNQTDDSLYISRNDWFDAMKHVGFPYSFVEYIYNIDPYLGQLMLATTFQGKKSNENEELDMKQVSEDIKNILSRKFEGDPNHDKFPDSENIFGDKFKYNPIQNSRATFWDLGNSQNITDFQNIQEYMHVALENIVSKSSKSQIWKGFVSVGPLHAIQYGLQKLTKSLQSRK